MKTKIYFVFERDDYTMDEWVDLIDRLMILYTMDAIQHSILNRGFSSFKEECYNSKKIRISEK
jgi:hypothetical protein